MADEHLLKLIRQGEEVWNEWRIQHSGVYIDLSEADLYNIDLRNMNLSKTNFSKANLYKTKLSNTNLRNVNFSGADIHENDLSEADIQGAIYIETNLSGVNLGGCDLKDANLSGANLSGANLTNSDLFRANLYKANLSNSILCEADLSEANLYRTDFRGANLRGASIRKAILVEAELEGTILTNSFVYGLSAWGCKGVPQNQSNLIITPLGEAEVTVDDLQVAQLIYLLLDRENLRNVLATITSKAVLILGRFTKERKIILDGIAEELRKHNLLPIIFDFERATSRDFTETIKILAGMSLFVIVDITNPKSAPLELQATIPDYQIPFITIIQADEKRFSMFDDLMMYDWVLQPIDYSSLETLRHVFKDLILERAIEKHKELQLRKTRQVQTLSADEYIQKKSNLNTSR